MKITLNNFEVDLVKFLCKKINQDGIERKDLSVSKDPEIMLNGFCGELAFCKLFNCYPDLTVEAYSAKIGTDKGDVFLFGRTIDVKTSKYQSARLVVEKNKKINGDYFALMTGCFPSFEFKGMIRQDLVIRPERLKDFHGNISYVVEQNELRIFDEIKNR